MERENVFKIFRAIGAALMLEGDFEQATEVFSKYVNKLKTFDNNEIKDVKKELLLTQKAMSNFLQNKFKPSNNLSKNLLKFQEDLSKNDIQLANLIEGVSYINESQQPDISLEILTKIKPSEKTEKYFEILADTYFLLGEYTLAIKNYNKTSLTDSIYNKIGLAYNKLYDEKLKTTNLKKACNFFDTAYKENPKKEYLKNKISSLSKLETPSTQKEVEKLWTTILSLTPDDNDYWDYARFCINKGDFEQAKEYIDYRYKADNTDYIKPKTNRPMWDCKKEISNKTLLVLCEKSESDTILYARFIKEAVKRAKKVIFISHEKTLRLFKYSFSEPDIYPFGTDISTLNFDYYIPLMSLMKLWDFSLPSETYLDVDKKDIRQFKAMHINQRSFNVGLMYSNLGQEQNNGVKLEHYNMLKTIKDIMLYSFQEEALSYQKETDLDFFNIGRFFKDYYDVAAALKNTHLVISDDNVILNLAGALGKSTFALLNKHPRYIWYKTDGDNIGWYKNVQPFTPLVENGWEQLMVKIKYHTEDYRVRLRENYLLACMRQVKSDDKRFETDSFGPQGKILQELYVTTYDEKYIKEDVELNKRMLKAKPGSTIALGNIATSYGFFLNKKPQAQKIWQKIISKVTSKDLLFNYGCFQCNMQNFKDFFKYYQERFYKASGATGYPTFNKPLWNGEKDVKDKTLLVYFEQGFGDTFLFSRYIPFAQELFKKVIVVINSGEKELIQESFPGTEVYGKKEFDLIRNDIEFDYHIPMLSLQIALNIYPTEYKQKSWLIANKNKIKEFKKYFAKDKYNIGIFWESSKSFLQRFTDLETMLPLAHIPGVQLYSLEIDKEDIEVNYLDNSVHIENIGKHFKNFSDTAGAIMNCDLVIATDSSVLNLSGALGQKTFGLFTEVPEWRWFKLTGEDCCWYKTVKPFHAEKKNNFKKVIKEISKEVEVLRDKKLKNR